MSIMLTVFDVSIKDKRAYGIYTRFFVRKIGYIYFVPKSVCRPSVRPCVRPSVRPSDTFLVIVSSLKPLDVATSNFADA